MKFLTPLDLTKNELQNAKGQNLASDPTPAAPDKGLLWYNSTSNLLKVWNGASADTLTNLLESVAGSGAISVSAVSGKSQTISIAAASGSAPGTMSSADYNLLHSATNANTASAIVQRDASGNFSAGTITAALTGTASNATNLNNQAASYYLSRANQTGTQTSSTISDLAATVQGYTLNSFAVPTGPLNLNSQRITGLADPSSAQDAATKNYVDSVASGLDPKASVVAATTAALPTNTYANGTNGVGATLTATANAALPTIDGQTLAVGNRVLVKNEATAANNGIYTVTNLGSGTTAWVLTRATDADTATEVTPGLFTFIEQGSTQATTGWVLSTQGSITIGTTALTFAQFSGGGTYSAGNGLSLAGSVFSAVGTANRIAVSGSGIDIASTYVGQSSITTLGTITTGTWNGTAIAVANGGTGATTVAAAKTNLGFVGRYAVDVGDGASTSITVTHNLGTLDVVACLYEKSTGTEVFANVTHATTNTLTYAFTTAPTSAQYHAVVIG